MNAIAIRADGRGTVGCAGAVPARPIVTVVIAALALVAWWVPGIADGLELVRGTEWREPWRLLTGHLAHFDVGHLAWDLTAFVILGVVVERRSRAVFGWTLLIAGAAISLCVLAWDGAVTHYRGLSGIDSALFAVAAVRVLLDGIVERDRWGVVLGLMLAAGLAGKIALEYRGVEVFVSSGSFAAVPVAHLVGAGVGMILAFCAWGAAWCAAVQH